MTTAYHTALKEARRELKEVTGQIEVLVLKRKQLETFIRSGEAIGGKPPRSDKHAEKPLSIPAADTPPMSRNGQHLEMWQHAVAAMDKYGRPVTAKILVKLLEKQGTPLGGTYKQENARALLQRRKDIFEKLSPGVFALKAWPAARKELPGGRDQQTLLQ